MRYSGDLQDTLDALYDAYRGRNEGRYGRRLAESRRSGGIQAHYNLGREGRFVSRLVGVQPGGSGADYHIQSESEFFRAIERARLFDRENMVVGQGLTRLIDMVIQDGIALECQTGNEKLDDALYELWDEWRQSPRLCHSRGMLDLTSLAKLALRSVIVDGDTLILPLETGQIEPLEAHRIRTPSNTKQYVINGVLIDKVYGKPLEYWVSKPDADLNQRIAKVADITPYPAFDEQGNPLAFHLLNPKRVTQTRGLSAFNPSMLAVGYHDDLQFATLVAAQVQACFAILRQRPMAQGAPFVSGATQGRGETTTETLPDGTVRILQGIGPGMEVLGQPGETLTGFTPTIPGNNFFQHASMLLGIVAVNLNLPLMVLLLDPSQTNFSGWRGAMQTAQYGFKEIQRWMIGRYYDPIYKWKVRQWLEMNPALRKLANAAQPYKCKWNPPRWAYIEPLKDAQADTLRLKENLISPRKYADERGLDYDDLVEEIVNDRAQLIEAAIVAAETINQNHPEAKVKWELLAYGKESQAAELAAAEDSDGQPATVNGKKPAALEAGATI